ncbi:hypothetical protein ACTMSW_17405 [Micromonospora sp. BQ11]|uniref:type II secretion system F family protein n=1 Tax=Micromonospora sp. BQ11 TaxID=3452212 RepID=UPI003F8A0E6B
MHAVARIGWSRVMAPVALLVLVAVTALVVWPLVRRLRPAALPPGSARTGDDPLVQWIAELRRTPAGEPGRIPSAELRRTSDAELRRTSDAERGRVPIAELRRTSAAELRRIPAAGTALAPSAGPDGEVASRPDDAVVPPEPGDGCRSAGAGDLVSSLVPMSPVAGSVDSDTHHGPVTGPVGVIVPGGSRRPGRDLDTGVRWPWPAGRPGPSRPAGPTGPPRRHDGQRPLGPAAPAGLARPTDRRPDRAGHPSVPVSSTSDDPAQATRDRGAPVAASGRRWRIRCADTWLTGSPRRTLVLVGLGALSGGAALGGPVAAVAAAMYAVLGVRAVLRSRSGRQAGRLRRQQLDRLCGLAADLRAGLPVSATDTPPPFAEADRITRLTRAAVQLADRTGAPLAELVERIEADARSTDRGWEAAAAQAAGARATAWLLAALPLGGVGLGYGIGVDPVAVLLHTPLGGASAIVAVVLQTAGLFWTERLTGAGRGDR